MRRGAVCAILQVWIERKGIEMDITITVVAIVVLGIAAESFILNRARERVEYEEAVAARLARYAGRQCSRASTCMEPFWPAIRLESGRTKLEGCQERDREVRSEK